MKRVLYVEGCYDGTVGGSHTCLRTLIEKLDRTRYTPSVVFFDDHYIAEDLRRLEVEVHVLKRKQPLRLSISQASWLNFPGLRSLAKLFQQSINVFGIFLLPAVQYARFLQRNRIDIVHLNNSINTNHEWIAAAFLSSVKLVSHERGISPKLSLTSRVLSRSVSHFICVSAMVAEHLQRDGLPLERMSVIYDGLDFDRFCVGSDPSAVRDRYGIRWDQNVIGVLGNVKEWKGQETLIRATKILTAEWPTILSLVIGTAYDRDPYVKRIKLLTEQMGIRENVRFLGFQKNPGELLGIMDVVCHTSITPEPFGMVNLEAMFMGRPVIATRIGGPLEIFRSGVDGVLVDPADPIVLAREIEGLLKDKERAMDLGRNARRAVLERFDATRTARAIEDLYESLC